MFGYGSVALPLSALYFPVYIFLADFYAVSYEIPIGQIGIVFLVVRLFDAVSDPIMGLISDKIPTRFGFRRPWMFIGTPVVMISGWFLFSPGNVDSVNAFYLFIWLFILTFGWTVILTPYFALGAEISKDYSERSSITIVREGLALLGTVIAALLYNLGESAMLGLQYITIFV